MTKKNNINQSLNPAFRKVKPLRGDIDNFKQNLANFVEKTLNAINFNESEEHHKNNLIYFLQNIYYKNNHYINTKDRDDLVIYNGKDVNSNVGVIIETKKPHNQNEMVSFGKFNVKSLQQLLFYYLGERNNHQNIELKHLIITDIYHWFIFDATLFERLFYQNTNLVRQFNDFQEGRLTSKKQDFFYQEIANNYISKVQDELRQSCTYFNLTDYINIENDHSLISLYKILSPQHLLKLPFVNDSNTLDKVFYSELLYIIGLIEVKEKGKKLIKRPPEKDRYQSSLLENTIEHLDTYHKLNNLKNIASFGKNKQERLFNVALELVITWINRILFLKLLEAQLINYNQQNKDYSFLHTDKI